MKTVKNLYSGVKFLYSGIIFRHKKTDSRRNPFFESDFSEPISSSSADRESR